MNSLAALGAGVSTTSLITVPVLKSAFGALASITPSSISTFLSHPLSVSGQVQKDVSTAQGSDSPTVSSGSVLADVCHVSTSGKDVRSTLQPLSCLPPQPKLRSQPSARLLLL
ncbi:hypothetical protein E2C01_015862 [Portunus trituberculatus]|uniref:Uncharacterized protein n=1 Tax=Portunus trituberculatus TaxID=210409 RepID=A0A5B7DNQ8_PORTR|nr:hypothetical protein [Portunus trituberculatus]